MIDDTSVDDVIEKLFDLQRRCGALSSMRLLPI